MPHDPSCRLPTFTAVQDHSITGAIASLSGTFHTSVIAGWSLRLTFHWFPRETEPCHVAKCFHNGFPEPIAFSNDLNLSKSLRPCPFLVSCRFLHRFSKHMAVWISFLECLQHWIADDRCPCPVKPGLSILKRLPRTPGSMFLSDEISVVDDVGSTFTYHK